MIALDIKDKATILLEYLLLLLIIFTCQAKFKQKSRNLHFVSYVVVH